MYRSLVLFVASLSAAGCASTPAVQPAGPNHPASVDAASSPMPAASANLSEGTHPTSPPADAGKPAHGDMAGMPGMAGMATAATSQPSAVAAYVCPMHPEVTSNAPGKCPKCGMKLVAKGGE